MGKKIRRRSVARQEAARKREQAVLKALHPGLRPLPQTKLPKALRRSIREAKRELPIGWYLDKSSTIVGLDAQKHRELSAAQAIKIADKLPVRRRWRNVN